MSKAVRACLEADGGAQFGNDVIQPTTGQVEKALGSEHPDIGISLNNLAGLYRAQGRYAEAEPLFRRSLGVIEKALGPEHPDAITALNELAYCSRGQAA